MNPRLLCGSVALSLFIIATFYAAPSQAATPADFDTTNAQIRAAYIAVYAAGQDGGNVTKLVSSLNQAVKLVGNAEMVNGSDPTLALSDIQNATMIASRVKGDAQAVAQQGIALRQSRENVSLVSAGAIVAAALLIYAYGARLYRWAWLRAYSGHTVRRVG